MPYVFSWVSFQWFQIVFWKFLKDFLILRWDIMYFVMPPTSQFGFVIVGSVRFQIRVVRQSGTQRAPGCQPEVSISVAKKEIRRPAACEHP